MFDTQPLERVPPPPRPVTPARRPARWRTATRAAGELLVTCGLVVLLFVVYELFVTDLLNQGTQHDLNRTLHQQWDTVGTAPATPRADLTGGNAFAVLYIPRLGADYQRVVLEGTAEAQLSRGPGHYVGTALPGQRGNVALAGHRVGKGSPFLDLDQLRPGDPIVVETVDSWFVYRVLGNTSTGDLADDPSGIPGREIVSPDHVEVISPTPDAAANAPATGSYLTLTTCHPRYSARQRMIIHARLDGAALPKASLPDGPPALNEH